MHIYERDEDNNLIGKEALLGIASRIAFAWQNCHLYLNCMLILGERNLGRLIEVYEVKVIPW